MRKLKDTVCPLCGERIKRHDKKRIVIQISDKVSKEAHTACVKENGLCHS